MKIKFPFIEPKKLEKHSVPLTKVDEYLNALEVRHLVLAWDDSEIKEEEPSYAIGFLNKVTFNDPTRVKFSIIEPLPTTHDTVELQFDHIAMVDDEHCPKVFYNNGTRQSVGYLVGLIEDPVRMTYDCVVRVPPFSEKKVDMVNMDGITYVEDIKLGIRFTDENCEQSKEADHA
jgi:hypothetical protein